MLLLTKKLNVSASIALLVVWACGMVCAQQEKTIYITPGQFGQLFNIVDPFLNKDNYRRPLYDLREEFRHRGYTMKQANSVKNLEDCRYLIVFDVPRSTKMLQDIQKYPKEKRILFLWEPPSVWSKNYDKQYHKYFSKIFTWRDDLVDNKKYFKFYYYHPNLKIASEVPSFKKRKLTCMIASNKHFKGHKNELYSARKAVIRLFESNYTKDFDLYGFGWQKARLKTYKGSVDRKIDYLKKYRFSFCYENVRDVTGYISEKIFDCFVAGCVPVYWGAGNITDYVPANCFIDRRKFKKNRELYRYLKNMPEDTWNTYIENIRTYLKSEMAHLYTGQNFIQIFVNHFT